VLGLGAVDEQQLYGALDWLVEQQDGIEKALVRRHLKNGTLVLYDVSSTYFEGRTCELAQFGHNRDGKHGKLQIVLRTVLQQDAARRRDRSLEVQGSGDPSTLQSPDHQAQGADSIDLDRVVLIGDRGMIPRRGSQGESVKPDGLDFITALRRPCHPAQLVRRRRTAAFACSTIAICGRFTIARLSGAKRSPVPLVSPPPPPILVVLAIRAAESGRANAARLWPQTEEKLSQDPGPRAS